MKNKISYTLITYIFLISLVVTSISAYIQLSNTYKHEMNSFKKEINNIEKNRIQILSQSLWNVNIEAVDIFLKNLINDENIIHAKIIEDDGNIIEIGEKKEQNIIIKEFKLSKSSNDSKHNLGKLIITADLDPLYSKIRSYAISTITTEIIKMLLIAILIIYILKVFLTNKIEHLASYANNLTLDNLDKPFLKSSITKSIDKQNELDVVVKLIDDIRINLLEQIVKSREKDHIVAHQSKMAAMGEMIGNIAHQWRQPLSIISTAATGLKVKHEVNVLDSEDLMKTLDTINNSTKYLSTTIDDFRNFFKPNKEKNYFNLNTAFKDSLSLVNHQFTTNEIIIDKNILDTKIYGFKNELIQVIINILNNARDALVINKIDKKILIIDTIEDDKNLTITIKDNAGGIKENLINRIFEPYFTTKNQSQGTGIGLYICEEIIVKHMNGSVFVKNIDFEYENIQYTGALFKLTFPKVKK